MTERDEVPAELKTLDVRRQVASEQLVVELVFARQGFRVDSKQTAQKAPRLHVAALDGLEAQVAPRAIVALVPERRGEQRIHRESPLPVVVQECGKLATGIGPCGSRRDEDGDAKEERQSVHRIRPRLCGVCRRHRLPARRHCHRL